MFHGCTLPTESPLGRQSPTPSPLMKSPALAACVLMAFACPVFSQNVTWDTVGPNHGGEFGNTLLFHDSGHQLAVTSWGFTGGSDNTSFEEARGSLYTIGMGVSNAEEGTGNPDHQMDNAGGDDWMLFYFDGTVDDVSVMIDPYGTYDRDATYYTATLDGPLDLSGLNFANLAMLGFSERTDDMSTYSGDAREVDIQGGPDGFNVLLFGAWKGEPSGDGIDRFKISSVSATYASGSGSTTTPTIPEPSGMLLGMIGALGMLRRKR
jgi:hypothetical protein